jgi:uncharacterized membrane protein
MKKKYLLAVILLLAVIVRAYGIWAFPFEQDELYTIDEATNLFHTRLMPGIQARPVFFLLEHPLVTMLPHTAVILRMLPFVFGILGIWITWLLASKTIGERGGLIAAFLAALSPWHIYASGFGRYYSLIYLLAALVYWLLPIAYDTDRPKYYLATLIPLLVGMWTHPSFIFPVIGVALAVMLVRSDGTMQWRWPTRAGWTFLWVPFVAASVLIASIIHMVHRNSTVANGGDRGLLATLRLIPAMVDWMTAIVFVAALIGALIMLRIEPTLAPRLRAWRQFGVMATFGVTGMLIALFLLSFVTAIYADYGIAALPLVFVAAAGLIQWIAEMLPLERQRGVTAAVTALVLIGMLPSVLSHLSDGTRFDYRPAFAHITATAPQLAVLTWPLIIQREYAPRLHGYELPTTPARLDLALATNRDIWAVVSVKRYGIVGDDGEAIATWLNAHCRQADQYQRPRLDYRMYRVDLWRCTAGT